MNSSDIIAGIDLGTTNSEISAFFDHKVEVIGSGKSKMLPSCVGLSTSGRLLVGASARNQQLIYPEMTVRSIKRKMGTEETVTLGDKTFTPQEISGIILRELTAWAGSALGAPVEKAVISVPAYFSDAQRNATREAGALAGLEVVRILNEPTAASLAYGYGSDQKRTVMIYDLGGGTFDVSVVTIEQDVTEVLSSHGNNRLGGDDFNELLMKRFVAEFEKDHGINLQDGHPAALSRLWWTAEDVKKRLSAELYVNIREEALLVDAGKPLHLNMEISREELEDMIRPQIESTLECVSRAMSDAGKQSGDLDAILLVGGSTRIPMIERVLEERAGVRPRHDVHPDLCVCLGAGVLASRLSGQDVDRVLVDVTPYSFGPSYLGEQNGMEYPYCYHPVIHANTALPVTRTEKYWTSSPYQETVLFNIFQGEDPDAMKNIPLGDFKVHGLKPKREPNEVLCKMSLDIDGILHVTAIEKETGLSKQITIDNAMTTKDEAEIEKARARLQHLFDARDPALESLPDDEGPFSEADDGFAGEEAIDIPFKGGIEDEADESKALEDASAEEEARKLLSRSRALLRDMHEDDQEEAIELHEQIEAALETGDAQKLAEACEELKELLFFVEGGR
ncbi:MAG: Hsp70 family protein [Deltaproteobacteria bacterium]|nr:Hsp70 family protein [Deltaproteobacteria bacterium]